MSQRFDPLLRELIPVFPGSFARLLVPHLATGLDLRTLSFHREEYFLPSPRGGPPRRPDLVGRVSTLTGSEVLLHVEIENRYRAARVAGIFEYNQLLRLSTGSPVYTVVVYCHGGPAGVQRQLHQDRFMGEIVTDFHYRSLGLSRMPAKQYLDSPEPLAWALASLAKPKRRGRAALRVQCLERIVESPTLTEAQRFHLFNFVATAIESDKNLADEYDEYLERANREVQKTMMTWADRIKEEGRLEGHEAGHEAGRLAGMQAMVLDVLEERFARVPKKVSKAILGIQSTERLHEIVRRAAVADSLTDIGIA